MKRKNYTAYLALYTFDPNGITLEVTGANYSRVELPDDMLSVLDGSKEPVHNGVPIRFPTPGAGGWGTVTHLAVMDSNKKNAGVVTFSPLTQAKEIREGDNVLFDIGDLTLTPT